MQKYSYNPTKFNPSRGGHAQGHLRETFLEIPFLLKDQEITLDTKVGQEQRFTVGEIIGLLWNCTDILPRFAYEILQDCNVQFEYQTYSAASRALKRYLSRQTVAA